MAKTYFNNVIIGNSRMLGCLSDGGELVRLFWPHIDYPQHIEKMSVGVFTPGEMHSTRWLDGEHFQHSQKYIKDTNIVETLYSNYEKGLRVRQLDFCLLEKDVLVRHYEVENLGSADMDAGIVVYSACINTVPEVRSVLFDFRNEALIHYKHDYYIALTGDREVYQFQLGNNARDAAAYSELKGYDSIGMMPDGAVSWRLGGIKPGEKAFFTLKICAAHTLKGVKSMVKELEGMDVQAELEGTRQYWLDYIAGANRIHTGIDAVDSLYRRSLLVFKLAADERSGGLLAAPEIDEEFSRCGRYAYCWGRDAAFITGALDKCGLYSVVDRFYEWAKGAQEEDGSWQQRYHMDGNLAPSWGLQVDETGTLIWGMLEHYRVTGSMEFLKGVWDSVKRGTDFLAGFIDEETGLPKPSYDLWEERVGEHTYSSAAVYGGIKAGIEIAGILGVADGSTGLWEKVCHSIREAMEGLLWKEEHGCFIRSVRVKLNPWGGEPSDNTTVIEVNPKGYKREVSMEDWTVDVSLLGVAIPFRTFDPRDPRVESTVNTIERVLTSQNAGGIRRYENDNYIGGNPWVLTTLWVALYYIEKKEFTRAREYFEWAVRSRTELELLPEQVGREDGRAAWVIPLTWSHAMFVLVLFGLLEAGELGQKEEKDG